MTWWICEKKWKLIPIYSHFYNGTKWNFMLSAFCFETWKLSDINISNSCNSIAFNFTLQKCSVMSHKVSQDSEPLIESSSTSPPLAKNNRWRINKRAIPGFNLRRKDPKGYQERCGRVRLLAILCAFVCFLIYLTNLKPYQNLVVVRIPEDDQNLPGPKGLWNLLKLNAFCFAVNLLSKSMLSHSISTTTWCREFS